MYITLDNEPISANLVGTCYISMCVQHIKFHAFLLLKIIFYHIYSNLQQKNFIANNYKCFISQNIAYRSIIAFHKFYFSQIAQNNSNIFKSSIRNRTTNKNIKNKQNHQINNVKFLIIIIIQDHIIFLSLSYRTIIFYHYYIGPQLLLVVGYVFASIFRLKLLTCIANYIGQKINYFCTNNFELLMIIYRLALEHKFQILFYSIFKRFKITFLLLLFKKANVQKQCSIKQLAAAASTLPQTICSILYY
eukprot:TRINITY_DN7462_c0_g1_i2.p3 TRINITY_DN7462_c0_g1~~TRINITY_DN7462_c0_g1_i2.p3  ORF type:complete len:248 (+),score=-24.38 TRINITY_DN7462_c0_g1_i2:1747-2490(+)